MQEKKLTAVIFVINLAAAALAEFAVFHDEEIRGTNIIYNFCMSRGTRFGYNASPFSKFRILENISVLASLVGKVFLYVKMWTRISLMRRTQLPEECRGRCKELVGLLRGKLLYSLAELRVAMKQNCPNDNKSFFSISTVKVLKDAQKSVFLMIDEEFCIFGTIIFF